VFGIRKPSRTHSQLLMDELAESANHLRLAAAHAAGGAAEKLTPGYDRARNVAARGWSSTRVAFQPVYEQAREGAANARRTQPGHQRSRWTFVAGILAAGAAVGAVGAVMTRRRHTAAWDEYEPLGAETGYGTTEEHRMTGATRKVAAGAASVAGSVSNQAGKLADSLQHRSGQAGERIGDAAEQMVSKGGDMAQRAAEGTASKAGDASQRASDLAEKAKHSSSDSSSTSSSTNMRGNSRP
jgi:hypothetical protein